MAEQRLSTLSRLSDTDQTVADPGLDVRGMLVMDTDGEDLGTVDDLLIDPVERRAHFLRVSEGGFLGFGAARSFIPVEAVRRIADRTVYVEVDPALVADVPGYDPPLIDADDDYDLRFGNHLYGSYGHAPFPLRLRNSGPRR